MISIIGAGNVGSAIAFLCGTSGLDEVVLINRNENKAIGEALDISNAIPETSKVSIRGTSDYSAIKNSSVIVITASVGSHINTRSDIMLDQSKMISNLSQQISKYSPNSKILMVTNPVDIMTYLLQKLGRLKSQNVIGIASSLDSSRFRYILAKQFHTVQSEIHDAMVLGEHDDSMVPIFSQAKYGKTPIEELLTDKQKAQITSDVRDYWKSLRYFKGTSVFGIAKKTFDALESITEKKPLDTIASTLLEGQYGFNNICMGVPVTINENGISKIHQISINDTEKVELSKSANVIQANIDKLNKFLNSTL